MLKIWINLNLKGILSPLTLLTLSLSLSLSHVCVPMRVLVSHGPALQKIYFFFDRIFSYNVSLTSYDVAGG